MKLTHVFIASTALLSFGAMAEGNDAMHDRTAGAGASMQQDTHASSSVIRQAQEKLSAAGHDAGPADGIMGPKTAQALKDFQQAKGLDASGRLDQRTRAELGLGSTRVGASAGASAQGSVGGSTSSDSEKTPSRSNESNPAGSQRSH